MNVHPIFVHFPIALLTVYALLEMFRLPWLVRKQWYFYVKAVLVLAGTAGSFAAYITGDMVRDAMGSMDALMRVHSQWAVYTIWLFVVVSLAYLVAFIGKEWPALVQKNAMLVKAHRVCDRLVQSPLMVVVALLGLAAVTITGSLGGAIVYGPDADPVVKAVTGWLVP